MKKILLSFSACLMVAYASSQVICKGVSPSNIAGNYTFSWAPPTGGWGTPDFLIPNTFVEDTLDGSWSLGTSSSPDICERKIGRGGWERERERDFIGYDTP